MDGVFHDVYFQISFWYPSVLNFLIYSAIAICGWWAFAKVKLLSPCAIGSGGTLMVGAGAAEYVWISRQQDETGWTNYSPLSPSPPAFDLFEFCGYLVLIGQGLLAFGICGILISFVKQFVASKGIDT